MSVEPSQSARNLAANAFEKHFAALQRYLARRIGLAQDCDDLAQEVFARLLRVRDADLVREPLTYMLGIATHVVVEFKRRQRHERVVYDSEVTENLCDHPEHIPRSGYPEQLELQNGLDKALAKLPPTHRLVLLLVKRDGMSYPEAGKATGLSVHTVEKYMVEARARLRVLLK